MNNRLNYVLILVILFVCNTYNQVIYWNLSLAALGLGCIAYNEKEIKEYREKRLGK